MRDENGNTEATYYSSWSAVQAGNRVVVFKQNSDGY